MEALGLGAALLLLLLGTAGHAHRGRVLGGSECARGAHAGLVRLFQFDQFVCGGALVSPGWVLSAAHCAASHLQVRAGEHSLSQVSGHEQFAVAVELVVHPEFGGAKSARNSPAKSAAFPAKSAAFPAKSVAFPAKPARNSPAKSAAFPTKPARDSPGNSLGVFRGNSTRVFPAKPGYFPVKPAAFPRNSPGVFPRNSSGVFPGHSRGDSPADPGDFPANPGYFPADPGDFPADPGDFPANPGYFPADPDDFPADPGRSHDLMLLRVEPPFTCGPQVRPLPLAQAPPSAGSTCTVMGWGSTSSPEESYPEVPQCLNVTVLSDSACSDAYGPQVTPDMLCAGVPEGGRDSCQGDSGGPLLCGGVLQAVVSWGEHPCGQPGRPGVYARVEPELAWIRAVIGADAPASEPACQPE